MLEMLAGIILVLCMLVGMQLRYVPFRSFVLPKQKRTLFIAYAVANIVNLLVLAVMLYIWQIEAAFSYLRFGGIAYAAVLTLINILIIRGKFREHMFIFGVVIACHYSLLSVPNYIVNFLSGYSVTMHIFTVLGLYLLLLLLTYWPMRELVNNTVEPFLYLDSSQYWNTIWFIPIAFFGTKFLSLGGEHNTGGIQQIISSMLYVAVIVLICMATSNGLERMQKNQIMEKQLADQKLHYTELKVRVEEARKTKHDFKHHIAAIRHYMDIDDKEGLRSYCNEFMERTDGRVRIPYTGNVAADGVLYYYMQRAQQEHIQFRYSGTIHSQGIADVDLCVLLGNALDNALTACLKVSQERSIRVFSQSEKKLLSIVIHNTFDGKVEQSDGILLSSKRQNRQGVGLTSMRSICERYGGSLDVRWDDGVFTVMILLPLSEDLS